MNGINEILSHTSYLETLSLVLLVISISCLIGGIVMWFVLDIPHSIRVLTGLGAAKSIDELTEGAKHGLMRNSSSKLQASLNWNTSAKLDRTVPKVQREALETELLSPETELLFPETPETEILEGFKIEEDIIITGTDKKLG